MKPGRDRPVTFQLRHHDTCGAVCQQSKQQQYCCIIATYDGCRPHHGRPGQRTMPNSYNLAAKAFLR